MFKDRSIQYEISGKLYLCPSDILLDRKVGKSNHKSTSSISCRIIRHPHEYTHEKLFGNRAQEASAPPSCFPAARFSLRIAFQRVSRSFLRSAAANSPIVAAASSPLLLVDADFSCSG